MVKYSSDIMLDNLDKAILQILQTEGRISHVDLAGRVNLSPPAVHGRIKRLEKRGLIRQYVTLLDREALGYDMVCFVNIGLQLHQFENIEKFRAIIQDMPEVLECYHLTGEYDYLLKIVVRNRKELEQLVVGRITPIPGVARIYTSLIFDEVKCTTALPVE